MREIKFRGRDKYKHWHYGGLYINDDAKYAAILNNRWTNIEVDYKTVGQFTGLLDCDGREIYEGDVVRYENCICLVVYNSTRFASFALRKDGWAFDHYFGEAFEASECQVIGNVHDSPELLEADHERD